MSKHMKKKATGVNVPKSNFPIYSGTDKGVSIRRDNERPDFIFVISECHGGAPLSCVDIP